MKQRRTLFLVVGMGGLLVGLLTMQFSWVRALVEARSSLFDEQARTALVEVQSVLTITGCLLPFRPVAGDIASFGPPSRQPGGGEGRSSHGA